MDKESISKQIETAYKKAGEAGNEFAKALMELRQIRVDFDKDNDEELKEAMQFGRDIDMRTAYLLRGLLIQHGNTLFL